ncbi:pilus assembly protein [Ideonella paludis]|uniref:pilus assembly protein n=1 Tax=Ideonella paludis TaxID=1233411 RepID=UPI0036424F5A
MALPLTQLVRKAAVAAIALMGVSTIMWSFAQSQALPAQTASTVDMRGQVIGPATSPTLNSTYSITRLDDVKWITYLQSRIGSPFEATGETSFENPLGTGDFKWIQGKLVVPPNMSFEWFVKGSGWTTTEPTTGTPVTRVKWKMGPMVRVDFGVVNTTVDFTGTGDGFRIIPFGKNLYVLNHHTNSQYFNCRVAATGAACPNFPSNGTGLGLARFAGQAASTADRTYYMVHNPMEAINYETGELFVAGQRGNALDVVCVNLNSLVSCGSLNLGTYTTGNWGGNHAPLEQIGDKYFVLAANGDLHCVNIKTKVSCGKTKYDISGTTYPNIGAFTVSSKFGNKGDDLKKVFFAIAGKVFCHDAERGGTCAGWSAAGNPSQFGGVMPILNNDADGTPKGVCDGFGTNCYTIAGASFQTSAEAQTYFMNNSFAPRTYWNGGSYGVRNSYHYSWNAGAVIGTRLITGQSNGYGVSCFDFAKNAVCPGYPKRTDVQAKGYTTNMDPTRANCVLHLGDAARALLFDVDTGGACKDGSEAEKPKTMDVDPSKYYRCDATQATVVAWDKVRISPSLKWNVPGGLKSVKVTLQDANGAQLPPLYNPVRYMEPGTYDLRIGLSEKGEVDANTVPYAQYPRLRVIVQMTGNGGLSTTQEMGMDVTWKGDPIQLCYETKTPENPSCPISGETKVDLARFELPDNIYDDTIYASMAFMPGLPNSGYAAVSAVTSPRSILSDTIAGPDGRTRILQGRFDMSSFTGDLWSYNLDGSGNVDASTKQTALSKLTTSLSRPVFSAKPTISGLEGTMTPYKLSLAAASPAQQTALNTDRTGVLDNRGNDRVNYHFGTDGPFRARVKQLGPVVNSGPVVLNRNTMPSLPENLFKDYTKYRASTIGKNLPPVALWGGNDGALHAFSFDKSGTLAESWTFVPDVMLKLTNRMTDSTLAEMNLSPYSVDAIPMIGHADLNGKGTDGWAAVGVITYGQGARAITALDISGTDPTKGKGVIFEYTNATLGDPTRSEGVNDLADLGRIVSQPAFDETLGSHQIVRVKDGSEQRWAVLVGNGVDSADGIAGSPSGTGRPVLYAFYLDTPASGTATRWRRIDVPAVFKDGAKEPGLAFNNGLSTPRPVDTDGDGNVDVAYAGDIQGNLWRFDLSNLAEAGTPESGKVTRLFRTIGNQPIYTVPTAVRNTVQGACAADKARQCWQVTFGTGHYFSPIQALADGKPTQYLYGLVDKGT